VTVDQLLEKWLGKEGGAERANYQMFLTELCQALDLPAPNPKGSGLGDYQFEAPVKSEAALSKKGTGRIDLYKRGHFILEAKQSQVKPGEAPPEDPPEAPPQPVYDLFGNPVGYEAPKRAAPRYDRLMADARLQAERYALALPADHDAPPFLIVADIGRSFELYFDWSGNGRGYGFFPNQQSYRIGVEDLASNREIEPLKMTARDVLHAVWTNPSSIDPRLRSAEVTRDIAIRLSRVAAQLEKDQRTAHKLKTEGDLSLGIEATSLFLMRLLFCMFAEDVELLPKKSFQRFLEDAKDRSEHFWRAGLTDLWSRMNSPNEASRYWSFGDAIVRYFNGNLFADAKVYDLPPEHKGELLIAAAKDWRSVEPAIFGTLLEQVLIEVERSKLGAHYTPRAYVERLVNAVIIDVVRPEWEQTRISARSQFEAGNKDEALGTIRGFHEHLARLRILDPACGTGNFLYVAMEQLLRLEGEAIQLAAELGATFEPTVHPNQFLGLELNPRAAVIAELVLWIGWLRHRLANYPESIGEPVLPPLTNINEGTHGGYDAVLVRKETGVPDTDNPRRPEWPEVDFILGNPPFIGGKDIRGRLNADHPGYAQALWKANPRVPPSADFVMQWWDRAADILTRPETRLKRFGFVTTNSITQVFSRRVIEHWLDGSEENRKLSLLMAIPDHPWTRAGPDAAAVRIAMTVAEAGEYEGCLIEIIGERKLDTDEPELDEKVTAGRINADLTVGTDVTDVKPLKANEGICSRGVQLMGSGFIVTPAKAKELGLGNRAGLERYIRDYRNGNDLLKRPRGAMVIDLFGLTEAELMDRYPEVYQHVRRTVYDKMWNPKANKGQGAWEGREVNSRPSYKKFWWIFGEPRRELRPAIDKLEWYIATVETAKHRIFHRFNPDMVPDNKLVIIADDRWATFGLVSSQVHLAWAERNRGKLEDRPVYVKGICFDPFPFPLASPQQNAAIGAVAEQLDNARRAALAENEKLTVTGLYNLVEALRCGALPPEQEAQATRARARIVAKLHDDLDAAAADAYGWEWPLTAAEIISRLVALNAERAAEEKTGKVHWLRPDYQEPRFGKAIAKA
jgi:hypothetical protein